MDDEQGPTSGQASGIVGHGRRAAIFVAAVVAAVVIAVIVAMAVRAGDGDGSDAGTTPVPGVEETSAATDDTNEDTAHSEGTAPPDLSATADEPTGDDTSATPTDAGTSVEATGDDEPTASTEPDASMPPATMETVPEGELVVDEPIDIDETAEVAEGGVTVSIVDIEAVEGEARGQFEIAGPSLRVTVEIVNDTDEEFPLPTGQIEVFYGRELTPGIVLSGPGVVALPDSIAPRSSATATVVYNVPPEEREYVQVVVILNLDEPVLVFEGEAPAV